MITDFKVSFIFWITWESNIDTRVLVLYRKHVLISIAWLDIINTKIDHQFQLMHYTWMKIICHAAILYATLYFSFGWFLLFWCLTYSCPFFCTLVYPAACPCLYFWHPWTWAFSVLYIWIQFCGYVYNLGMFLLM